MMGLAAVAGAVALLYMRSRGASADADSTGGVLTSSASWLNSAMGNASSGWGATPVTITVNQTKPLALDEVSGNPSPGVSTGSVVAGPSSGGESGGYLDAEGVYHYPDGSSAYTGGGTFGYVSADQRAGRSDAELALRGVGF